MAPSPLWDPADTLRRRGDLAGIDRQPISLGPTAQWVTLGEDWSYGRQPRQKIRQGAMPQGRSRPSSSKRPDTYMYPTPSWQVAWVTNRFSSEVWPKVLRAATPVSGPTAAWGTAGFMDGETATLRRGRPLMMKMM